MMSRRISGIGFPGPALGLERRSELLAGEGFFPRKQPRPAFDQGDVFGSEPTERLRHLDADSAAAEHDEAPGHRLGLRDVAVVPHAGVCQAVDRGLRRRGAGRDDHGFRGDQTTHAALGRDLDHALPRQTAVSSNELDALRIQPRHLTLVPQSSLRPWSKARPATLRARRVSKA